LFLNVFVGADAKFTHRADFDWPARNLQNPFRGLIWRAMRLGQRIPASWVKYPPAPTRSVCLDGLESAASAIVHPSEGTAHADAGK